MNQTKGKQKSFLMLAAGAVSVLFLLGMATSGSDEPQTPKKIEPAIVVPPPVAQVSEFEYEAGELGTDDDGLPSSATDGKSTLIGTAKVTMLP